MVPKVVGSRPIVRPRQCGCRIVANISAFQAEDGSSILPTRTRFAPVAQWIRASGFYPLGWGFESLPGYQFEIRQAESRQVNLRVDAPGLAFCLDFKV